MKCKEVKQNVIYSQVPQLSCELGEKKACTQKIELPWPIVPTVDKSLATFAFSHKVNKDKYFQEMKENE